MQTLNAELKDKRIFSSAFSVQRLEKPSPANPFFPTAAPTTTNEIEFAGLVFWSRPYFIVATELAFMSAARVPVCSAAMPPVKFRYSTSSKPASRINSARRFWSGNRDTESGRYS